MYNVMSANGLFMGYITAMEYEKGSEKIIGILVSGEEVELGKYCNRFTASRIMLDVENYRKKNELFVFPPELDFHDPDYPEDRERWYKNNPLGLQKLINKYTDGC